MFAKNSVLLSHLFLALLSAFAGVACAPSEEALGSEQASLIGGRLAEEGQFPASVALLTPLPSVDSRYCMREDRRCTMTRVGPRAYLAAGHCFADKDELEQRQRVVLSPLFAPGARVR